MPEYLAPGVYVEETSFRSKSIEGVSTTTTGFVGPCRYGPVNEPADVITSLGEFERTYAGGGQLEFEGKLMDNFLWHAARAFFTEGGKRLYVARVFRGMAANKTSGVVTLQADGRARAKNSYGGATFAARFPGAASDLIVQVVVRAGQNILGASKVPENDPQGSIPDIYERRFNALADRDLVLIVPGGGSIPHSIPQIPDIYAAEFDAAKPKGERWLFRDENGVAIPEAYLQVDSTPEAGDSIYVLTVSVTVLSSDRKHDLGTWADLPLHPDHKLGGSRDSLFEQFGKEPATISEARSLPLTIEITASPFNPLTFVKDLLKSLDVSDASGHYDKRKLMAGVPRTIPLVGGNDGIRPGSAEYEGIEFNGNQNADPPEIPYKTGLKQFEDVEDISIVAAPGCTADYSKYRDDANSIMGALINHAERMRYRIAVLDSPPKHGIADVRRVRAKLDSKYAAFYYPWVTILDPVTRRELNLPPSGFVAGIYARNDINRAVYKAPANEVVNLAIGFEQTLNKAQQEVLNPEGINCFRFFEGRGFRLWGARTTSSDPEWKYVNLRRYFAYLERSIDKGTQWAVFEPNGELLWANVRRTVEDFLLNEWTMGALLGDKPEKAYFVKCDRSTMTQNDLDNGRLICLVGVAALRPAEFVIFRIGQWTGDRKV